MKYSLKVFVLFSLLLFVPISVFAEHHPKSRLISVTGDAEVRVVPDEVAFTLGIETSNKSLAKAKQENDQRVTDVIKVAEKYGIQQKHIQTDFLSIDPSYDNRSKFSSASGVSDIQGYFVRKTIVIILRELSKFEGLSSDVLEAGVTHVHGIDFRTTELRKHRDQARALAVKAAKEKATALAGELDQTIGEPHSIQENRSWWYSGYNSWWGNGWSGSMSQNVVQNSATGNDSGTDSGVALGQIKVNATVSVSFELR